MIKKEQVLLYYFHKVRKLSFIKRAKMAITAAFMPDYSSAYIMLDVFSRFENALSKTKEPK